MADQRKQRERACPVGGRFKMCYFDAEWNELENLRADNLGPPNVMDNVERWLFERDLIRVGVIAQSVHLNAVYISVEEYANGQG